MQYLSFGEILKLLEYLKFQNIGKSYICLHMMGVFMFQG